MSDFHGVIPYLVSPTDEAGNIKKDVLAALCGDLIAAGVHGLSPLGSTGEFAYLNREQKRDVVDTVVKAAAGRVPVLAGVAATTIAEAAGMAREWEQLGCQGILATLESYFPLNEDGVYAYFAAVAEAVNLPVILYTNPNFQRTDLSIPVIKRLAKINNIAGIKDASSNTGRLLSIINACGSDLEIFSASAHIPVNVMLLGGKGFMAGPACLAPRQNIIVYDLCTSRQWDKAMMLQKTLWKLNQAFAKYNLAACVKGGLELQGYAVGTPLPPQAPLSPEGWEELAAVMKELGVL